MKGSFFRTALVILTSVGLASASLTVATPTPVQAAVITVPADTIGINVEFKPGVDEAAALDQVIAAANMAAEEVSISSAKSIGLGWYSLAFDKDPTDSDAQLIAAAIRSFETVATTSFDVRVQISTVITPTAHLYTFKSSSYTPDYRYLSATNAYDSSNPTVGKIKFRWKRPSKKPHYYVVAYAKSSSGPWKYKTIKSYSTYPSYTFSGLTPGQTYYFKVKAKYSSTRYSSYSKKSVSTFPVVKPVAVKLISGAVATGASEINAEWFALDTVSARGGASSVQYRMDVYRKSDNSLVASTTPGTATNATTSGLVVGDYYAKIVTINSVAQTATTGNSSDFAYLNLWYLNGSAGVDVQPAWSQTQGGDHNVTVAVIDTGFTNAPILKTNSWWDSANNHYYGYDFVGNTPSSPSNDGNGWDSNPTDPGDYSLGSNSSWHGTQVGSIIAGWLDTTSVSSTSTIVSANRTLGVSPKVKLLPIRVLGPKGGSSSDLIAAINWAAGFTVIGTPVNLHPARVINLSMGSPNAVDCDTATQNAITNAVNAGVIFVTAAGNFGLAGLKANQSYPGNCFGTVNVGASGASGDKSFYTNLGSGGSYSGIDLSAPGGDSSVGGSTCSQTNCITTTINTGSTNPTSTYSLAVGQGTSFAAPIVSGVLALMLSVNSNLTLDSAATILVNTATPFAPDTWCAQNSTDTYFECGAGIVNAGAAVAQAANQ